jgi:hypothetical protein
MRTSRTLNLVALASAVLLACGGSGGPASSSSAGQSTAVRISPATASLAAGDALSFAASVTGTSNTAVKWSVTEPAGGTIDGTGAYVAPQAAGIYHVVATSVADPTSSASGVVTVAPTVQVSPLAATIAPGTTLQLGVDAADTANGPVTWSIDEGAAGGTITSTGLYTAPEAQGTYTVVASVPDPTATDSSSRGNALTTTSWRKGRSRIVVSPPISVAVSPTTASVTAGAQLSLTATVANTTNTSVTWSVQEGSPGGAVSSAGVYTAPATPGTYHVVATSVANTGASASSTVTVNAAQPPPSVISVTVNPSATSLTTGGAATLTATVANSANQVVAWSVQEGAAGGTVTSAGAYTAPATAGTYHVVATSQADTTKSATATITVTAPAAVISVSVNPSAITVTTGAAASFTASVANSSNQGVTWSVQEGASGGTVTPAGAYTAPSTAGSYHVVATSQADSSKSAAATVTVTTPSSPPPSSPGSCASEPLRTTGTTYYVCSCDAGAAAGCVPGNDSNSGTSPSAPWQSITKAHSQFNVMNGGDTIALCQGGSWQNVAHQASSWGSSRCSASATCDLRDYPTTWGAGVKPMITTVAQNGTAETPLFFMTTQSGLRIFNLSITGALYAIWTQEGSHNVDACNLTLDQSNIGMYQGGYQSGSHDNALRQSTITNSIGQGWFGACDNCLVDNNVFRNNGGTDIRHHNVYVGNPSGAPTYTPSGMKVTNNDLSLSAGAGGYCNSVELVVHDPIHNLALENNFIHETAGTGSGGCYGIQVNSGGDVVADFTGLIIRRNRVFTTGGNHTITWAEAPNALIEDNIVVVQGPSSDASNGLTIYEPYTAGPPGSVMNTANTVRNNTIYLPSGTHGGDAIAVNVEGSGHIVTGNVIVSYSDQTQQTFNCLNNNLSSGAYALVDSNACWKSAGSAGTNSGTNLIGNTAPPSSLSSVFVNASSDPSTANFTPSAGSPLVGKANSASSCTVGGVANRSCSSGFSASTAQWSATDTGKTRVDLPTDIGAYEH